MNRTRILVVGAGFAGYHAAKTLCRRLRGAAEVILVNPTDYFLYLPLLPEVAGRRAGPAPDHGVHPGHAARRAAGAGLGGRRSTWPAAGSRTSARRATRGELAYDQLLLTTGSVNKLLPVPGRRRARARLPRHRRGALPARPRHPADRAGRQQRRRGGAGGADAPSSWSAPATPAPRWPRRACCSPTRWPAATRGWRGHPARWLLVDTADRVLPGLGERLAAHRGPGAARSAASTSGPGRRSPRPPRTASGSATAATCPTRSLIWCVGVRPDPLVERLGLPTRQGRLVVDEYLAVPGQPEVWACGDAAAVPDLTMPGEITPMTAQHAQRQGVRGRAQHRRVASASAAAGRTSTTTSASSSTSAAPRPRREPAAGAAVRAAGEGGHPRLPPALAAGQPGPHRGRLADRGGAAAAGRAARPGPLRRRAAGHRRPGRCGAGAVLTAWAREKRGQQDRAVERWSGRLGGVRRGLAGRRPWMQGWLAR